VILAFLEGLNIGYGTFTHNDFATIGLGQTKIIGILPKKCAAKQIASNQLDLQAALFFDQLLNLAGARLVDI
jgi:hypothetical protein